MGNVPDWGPLLVQGPRCQPDVFFSVDYNPAEDAAMIKQWVANPINALVYQQYGPSVPEYLELAGDAANGVIWATVLGYLPDTIGRTGWPKYEAKFNDDPGLRQCAGRLRPGVGLGQGGRAGRRSLRLQEGRQDDRAGHPPRRDRRLYPENHAGRCYPWQVNDPSLGQSHTIYQIQDKKQVLVFPEPYSNGKFETAALVQV